MTRRRDAVAGDDQRTLTVQRPLKYQDKTILKTHTDIQSLKQCLKVTKTAKTRKTSVTFLAEFDKLLVFFVAQAYVQHVVLPVLSKVCQWTGPFWFYNE